MAILRNIPYLIIILMFGYIMFLRECSSPCPECPQNDTIVEYHTDTIVNTDTAYIPRIVNHFHTDTIRDTVEVYIDYFVRNYYHDTILNDTNGFITISDTVSQNRIIYRRPAITLYPHFVSETIIEKEKLRNKVFLGLGLGRSVKAFGLSGNAGLLTKKDNLYTISYDVLNKDVYLTMYWKISFRR